MNNNKLTPNQSESPQISNGVNKIFQSKKLRVTLIAIGTLIILLVVFQVGMAVGFRKASFSYSWAENYHRNFAGPREGFLGNFMGRDFIDAHGVFGSIIKIDGSTLVIKGANNVEKTILLKDDTTIERLRETIKLSDLKVDDNIVVIGSPNDSGQIVAELIRVMPASPPSSASTTPQEFFPMMRMMRPR